MVLHPYDILARIPRNPCKIKQSPSRTPIIVISTVIILVILFFNSDNLSSSQATLLGVAGSTIFAVSVFFLSHSAQERKDYSIARSNAHILSSIISHVEMELLRISGEDMHRIEYPQNWLAIYTNIVSYLSYDYLSELIEEFSTIDNINALIDAEEYSDVQEMITSHWNKKFKQWNHFDIDDLASNLRQFSSSLNEQKHWTEERYYRDLALRFFSKFSSEVHSISINYLKENGSRADRGIVADHVLSELKNNVDFQTEFGSAAVYERFHLLNIFQVHLNAEKNSSYELCWGELILKKDHT
jgi:hypothetical protein